MDNKFRFPAGQVFRQRDKDSDRAGEFAAAYPPSIFINAGLDMNQCDCTADKAKCILPGQSSADTARGTKG